MQDTELHDEAQQTPGPTVEEEAARVVAEAEAQATAVENARKAEAEKQAAIEAANQPDPDEVKPEKVSAALLEEMHNAYNYWHTHGYPEKAAVLYECIQQKRRPPANLLPGHDKGIRPETAIDPDSVDIPPRHGPLASHDAWRAFAKKTIDMEEDVIDALKREDIIGILEDKGVIEKEAKKTG